MWWPGGKGEQTAAHLAKAEGCQPPVGAGGNLTMVARKRILKASKSPGPEKQTGGLL